MRISRARADRVREEHQMGWLEIEDVVSISSHKEQGESDYYIVIGVKDNLEAVKQQIGHEVDGVEIFFKDIAEVQAFARLQEILEKHRFAWLKIKAVSGFSTEKDADGNPAIFISIDGDLDTIKEQILKTIKDKDLEGIRIVIEDSDGVELAVISV